MLHRPIKTYQKKTNTQPLVTLTRYNPTLLSPDASASSSFAEENNKNHTDPFESTFDRIAKNAKLPPPPLPPGPDESLFYASSSFGDLSDSAELEEIPISNPIIAETQHGKKRKKPTGLKNQYDYSPPIQKTMKTSKKKNNEKQFSKKAITKQQRKKNKENVLREKLNTKNPIKIQNSEVSSQGENNIFPRDEEQKKCRVELTRLSLDMQKNVSPIAIETYENIGPSKIIERRRNALLLLDEDYHITKNSTVHSFSSLIEEDDKSSTTENLLKNCSVDLVKLTIQDDMEKASNLMILPDQTKDNDNNLDEDIDYLSLNFSVSKVITNNRRISKEKNCRVSLIRLPTPNIPNGDSLIPDGNQKNLNDQTFLSSTPLNIRKQQLRTKPKLSPINRKIGEFDVPDDSDSDSRSFEMIEPTHMLPSTSEKFDNSFSIIKETSMRQSQNVIYSIDNGIENNNDLTTSKKKSEIFLPDSIINTIELSSSSDESDNEQSPESIKRKSPITENVERQQPVKISKILSMSEDENKSRSIFDDTDLAANGKSVSEDKELSTLSFNTLDSKQKEKLLKENDPKELTGELINDGSDDDYSDILDDNHSAPLNHSQVSSTTNSNESQKMEIDLEKDEKKNSTSRLDDDWWPKIGPKYSSVKNNNTRTSRNFSEKYNDTVNNEKSITEDLSPSSSSKSDEMHAINIDNEKVENEYSVSKNLNKSTLNGAQDLRDPFVLLERLRDPVRISNRPQEFARNRNLELSVILEKLNHSDPTTNNDNVGDSNETTTRETKSLELANNSVLDTEENDSIHEIKKVHFNTNITNEDRKVFLKPGKHWARSLSILHRIHNDSDIESFSIGKGKNWRHSVMNVLNMQEPGSNVFFAIPESRKSETKILRESTHRSIPKNGVLVNKQSTSHRLTDASSRRLTHRESKIENGKISNISKEKESLFSRRVTSVYNPRCTNIDTDTIIPYSTEQARSIVLERCNQNDCMSFSVCYSGSFLKNCRKIGEGVYGEVFLNESKNNSSVIKIIPIEGSQLVNGEAQKKFEEILSEIIIAEELHNLRFSEKYNTTGFVEVINIRCLKGKYPKKLLELWNAYDEEKKSENDSPSMFSKDQMYIALELGNAGQDLEAFIFQNATETYSTFIQTALTLAVGEKSLNFEHRDMHWGNILIANTKDEVMTYKLDDVEIQYPCQGIKVSIIDFTLSRITYEDCCMYNDLALDPSLFTAVGDYQFDIYRLMKARLQNDWKRYEPHTNILWLHYTLDKMITACRYRKVTTKVHKNAIEELQAFKDVILQYNSAFDFVMSCEKIIGFKAN